eukprot:6096715-Pyramimonas_sp.AAC.1
MERGEAMIACVWGLAPRAEDEGAQRGPTWPLVEVVAIGGQRSHLHRQNPLFISRPNLSSVVRRLGMVVLVRAGS